MTATLALPWLFFSWYEIPATDMAGVRLALLLVGINLGLTFPVSVFDAVLWAFQRFDLLNAVDISVSLLRACLSISLVLAGGQLVGLAWVIVLCTILGALVKGVLSFRSNAKVRISWSCVNREAARELFSFGIWHFILTMAPSIRR